jgi:outer membrane receptor protein involved in Fe transport
MKNKSLLRVLLLFTFFFPLSTGLFVPHLAAQSDRGSLRVAVQDATGATVKGATVMLVNQAAGTAVSRSTGEDGYANFDLIPRGIYTVNVDATQMKHVQAAGIQIDIDQKRFLLVTMTAADVQQSIQVVATSNALQTEEASLGQVVEGPVIVELPLQARRYTDLALLTPGVTTASSMNVTTRGYDWFVANGNYATQNNFLLDGFDNNQGTTNAQSLSSQVVRPSPDAISEFKVQTNGYSAEFGRSAGAVVNVSLKSGTNNLHGSAYYFNRNEALAANSWTNKLNGLSREAMRWNQYGGSFGGPVLKNKLFYFGDYEGFLETYPSTYTTTVPTVNEKSGIFPFTIKNPITGSAFANNTIPGASMDKLGKAIIALYPDPTDAGEVNASTGRIYNNYNVERTNTEHTHKFDVHPDYILNATNSLSFRYSFLRQDIHLAPILPNPLADCGSCNAGEEFNRNQSMGVAWTHTFGPKVINVARFGYYRTYAAFTGPSANSETATQFGFSGIPASEQNTGGLPKMQMSNYQQLGVRNYRPQFQSPKLWGLMDTLSLSFGAHMIRTGIEIRSKADFFQDIQRTLPSYRFRGKYTGDDLADLFLGMADQFTINSKADVNQLQQIYAAFVQDDWKVTHRLTVNIGLRYDYTTPFYGDSSNRNINFDFTKGELVQGTSSNKYLVNTDYLDWGPRLGFNYQLIPNRLVMRAGFGIFYNGEDIAGSDTNLPLNPPQLVSITLNGTSSTPATYLSSTIPSNILTQYNTSTLALKARDKDWRQPQVEQYNLALQYQLPAQQLIEVAYVGNRGRHLMANYDANQTAFGVDPNVQSNYPYPNYYQIFTGTTRGSSRFNALEAKYNKDLRNGMYVLGSYTYASAIDNAGDWGSDNQPQVGGCFSCENGPMAQVARQRLTVASIYDIPFGKGRLFGSSMNRIANAILGDWRASEILQWRTGLPFDVNLDPSGTDPITGKTIDFELIPNDYGDIRPNRIGKANTGISPHTNRMNFLNVNAFQLQTANTPGNAGRNTAVGPRYTDFDLSINKQFAIGEKYFIDVHGDAFNLLNHTNYSNPSSTWGDNGFGEITSAGDPRIAQVAVRLHF